MKKKILSIALVVCIAITAIAGATLAYLTDTDQDTNTFTLGNITIDLIEQQRDYTTNEDGTLTLKDKLTDFVDDKILLPIVGSAQGETVTVEGYNLPTAANWVDKIVTVKNTCDLNAYVRVVFAFPASMDDAQSAAEMMLHWNHDGSEAKDNWSRVDNGATVEIEEGVVYNLYTYTYNYILKPDEVTASPAITGVYIDSRVDAKVDDNGNVTYFMTNGRDQEVSATFAKGTGPKIHVFAQGVQADGFDTLEGIADLDRAENALNSAFGEITADNNPWVD